MMMREKNHLAANALASVVALTLSAAAIASVEPVSVEPPGTQVTLDEIVISATKREEAARDVPMAVQAIGGDQLRSMAIVDLAQMAASVPTLAIGDGLVTNDIYLRGIGSGQDRGFEQSVSTFRDGIYLPRSRQSRSPFFDVDRIEVLKGPQAVLFGLNSTAGAISIIGRVNRPGDSLQGTITGAYETTEQGYGASAAVGGSVGSELGWRIALQGRDSGDGWLKDPVAGDQAASKDALARVSLVYNLTDSVAATFRWEHSKLENTGATTEIVDGKDALPGDGAAGSLQQRVDSLNAASPGYFDLQGEDMMLNGVSHHSDPVALNRMHKAVDAKNYRIPIGADQRIDNISLNLDWALGNYTLAGLFGYSSYYYDASLNVLATAEPVWAGSNYESYDQTSAELRITSPTDQRLEWIAGVYALKASLFADQPNAVDLHKMLGLATGQPSAVNLYELYSAVLDQDSTMLSGFVSTTWHINDTWRLKAGGRYSKDRKEYIRDPVPEGSGLYEKNPDGSMGAFLGGAILNANGRSVGQTSGKLTFDNFMPEFALQWDVGQDNLLFARYAKSAKSGGVATAASVSAASLTYKDEFAKATELGLKSRFLDGRAEANVILFQTKYEGLQVKNIIFGPLGNSVTIVGNAGKATSEGLEVDGRVAVTDWLTLQGTASWLNAQFDSYPAGPCNRSRSTPAGSVPGSCDLSGQELPYAPKFSANISADVTLPLANGWQFLASASVAYSDKYLIETTADPSLTQPAWTKIAGRIGFADDKWDLSLIGQNLTDEKTVVNGAAFFGYNIVYAGMPRTVKLQMNYKF